MLTGAARMPTARRLARPCISFPVGRWRLAHHTAIPALSLTSAPGSRTFSHTTSTDRNVSAPNVSNSLPRVVGTHVTGGTGGLAGGTAGRMEDKGRPAGGGLNYIGMLRYRQMRGNQPVCVPLGSTSRGRVRACQQGGSRRRHRVIDTRGWRRALDNRSPWRWSSLPRRLRWPRCVGAAGMGPRSHSALARPPPACRNT